MEPGQRVEVTEYGGVRGIKRVVADRGEVIVVCNEKEFDTAITEKRPPDGIGFPRKSVRPLSRQG
jgi:hypothetical protein